MASSLHIKGIRKAFGKGDKAVEVLKRIDIDVAPGEFLILVGSFTFSPGLVIFSTLGVILSAASILWLVQRVMSGAVTNPKNENLPDLNTREWATLLPLVFLSLFMGVFSSFFTPSLETPVLKIIKDARSRTAVMETRLPAPHVPAEPLADQGAHQ